MTGHAPGLAGAAPVLLTESSADEEVAHRAALPWLTDYLARPHPELGREGAVCPFVEPALRARTLHMRVDRIGPEADHPTLVKLVEELVTCFEETRWAQPNRTLHALVAVLPDLDDSQYALLDQVQSDVKPGLAERGYMLGQFHPECPEPAARNETFLVGRSSVPMLALRRMAFHDIMFLHRDARCFAAYEQRFGDRYRTSRRIDPLFAQVFRRARAAYASSGAPDEGADG